MTMGKRGILFWLVDFKGEPKTQQKRLNKGSNPLGDWAPPHLLATLFCGGGGGGFICEPGGRQDAQYPGQQASPPASFKRSSGFIRVKQPCYTHWLSGWPKKSPNFFCTTKMVQTPKSLKFMNSGSEYKGGTIGPCERTNNTPTHVHILSYQAFPLVFFFRTTSTEEKHAKKKKTGHVSERLSKKSRARLNFLPASFKIL